VRRASLVVLLATVGAAGLVLAGSSAAAGPRAAHPANSHVGTAGWTVVKQVGLRNYAGPNCPGKGWNCTKAKRVLQVAAAGGENVAQCTGTGTTPVIVLNGQSCSITQTGAATSTNYAKCYERSKTVPAAAQTCTITQTGANNTAIVDQLIVQTQGSTHNASQTATVTQTATGLNSSSVSQDVKQNTAGSGAAVEDNAEEPNFAASGGPQVQDAYQSATVTQVASGTGKNDSSVDQSEWQKAHGGTSQKQNNTDTGAVDCATAFGASNPNICANVSQTAALGTNANRLRQSLIENAKLLVAGTQNQGSSQTGMDGKVHQAVGSPTSSSQNDANQSKTQQANAPAGSTQTQFDPISCCGFASQDGGTGNREVINQSADLSATGGFFFQELAIFATSNSGTGSCTITQQGSVNGDSETNTGTVDPCPFVAASLECADSTVIVGDGPVLTDAVIIQQEGRGCFASAPDETGGPIQ
jgi:hypothetical protein